MQALNKFRFGVGVALMAGFFAAAPLELSPTISASAFAQRAGADDDEESRRPQTRRAQVLSRNVGQALTAISELTDAENYEEALRRLDQVLGRSNLSDYERATSLQIRGGVNAALENYQASVQDYEAAIALNALPPETNQSLLYNTALLYAALENWPESISRMERWIAAEEAAGNAPSSDAYYLLATGYVQTGRFREALPLSERAVQIDDANENPRENKHGLLNYIYSELNMRPERRVLMEKMVRLWPYKKTYWTQLSGLYQQDGDERDSFSILELAYLMGLLDQEGEFRSLAQYYSYFDNPYRGALVLEREMNAGNIERSGDDLELLAQLWAQAREHDRALPVLEAAARVQSSPTLFYQLGQTLFAKNQWARAETALRNALNANRDEEEPSKRLNREEIGQIWFLIASARYEAGNRRSAQEAFRNAANYANTRESANGWVQFIDSEIRIERQQAQLEERLQAQEAERERVRQEEAARARRLFGDQGDDDGQ